jgi:O-antigen/teichoic acid export membrane protein
MTEENSVGAVYPPSDGGASVTPPPVQGVYAKTVKGGFWYVVNAVTQKALQIVSFVILARLLVPEDYGVYAVILIVLGFFNQITNLPFGTTLIQRRGDVEAYLDPYWTLDILRSIVNAALIAVLGHWIAVWFHVERFTPLIQLCGILLVLPTFSNIRNLTLFRDMDFRTLAVRDILTQIVYVVTAVGYAFWVERSAWALVVGNAAMYVFGNFLSYRLVPGRARASFAFGRLRDLVGHAKWVYGQNLVDYAANFTDKILLGLTLAPGELGLYAKAKDLSTSPAGFIASVARKVGLSAFALVQDSQARIRQGMLRGIDVLFLTAVPAAIVFLLEGGTVIRILLGDNWLSIVIPFKIMAVGGIFLAVISIINTTVIAVGRPEAGFKANLYQTLLALPLSWVGIQAAGIRGLAVATLVVWLVLAAYLFIRVRHVIQLSIQDGLRYATIGLVTTAVLTAMEIFAGPFVHAVRSLPLDAAWVGFLLIVYYVVLRMLGRLWKTNPWETGRSMARLLRGPH